MLFSLGDVGPYWDENVMDSQPVAVGWLNEELR